MCVYDTSVFVYDTSTTQRDNSVVTDVMLDVDVDVQLQIRNRTYLSS